MKRWEKHTWVICAYKVSEYLEDAIKSVKSQTIKSNIIMVTSTPNDHIQKLSEKYEIPLFVNNGKAGIAGDWNFGYQKASTNIVTICHQDDIYKKNYLANIKRMIDKDQSTLIAFSGYGELRDGKEVYSNTLLNIKKLMLFPFRIGIFQKSKWIRRRILSMGSPICCPAVTFVKSNLPSVVFHDNFKSNLDWEAWEIVSKRKGRFSYVYKPLVLHRIHEESTTSEIIGGSLRGKEDFAMFCKFWPKCIAKIICKQYVKSERSNKIK